MLGSDPSECAGAGVAHLALQPLPRLHPQQSPFMPDNLGSSRTACPDRGSGGLGDAISDDCLAVYYAACPHQSHSMGRGTSIGAFINGQKRARPGSKKEKRDADSQTKTGFNAVRNPCGLKQLQNAGLSDEHRLCTNY